MCRHLDLMIEVFGEEPGCRMFRKIAPWYARRFGPCHEFNKRVVQVSTRAGFHEVFGKLHPLASAISRRERRIAAALPPAAAGRVLHARANSKPARTNSRAQRAGGSVVKLVRKSLWTNFFARGRVKIMNAMGSKVYG